MKRFISILGIAAAAVMASCIKDDLVDCDIEGSGKAIKEVEIAISTGASGASGTRGISGTRAELDGDTLDMGIKRERYIETLDLLLFEHKADGTGKFLYRAEAVRMSGEKDLTESVYRAKLREYDGWMDVHIFANCRGLLTFLDDNAEAVQNNWAWVHGQIVDEEVKNDPLKPGPRRIMDEAYDWNAALGESASPAPSDKGLPLPMYGKLKGRITDVAPSRWGKVELIRSVASFDVFNLYHTVQHFDMTDVMVAFAPEQGYIGELLANDVQITTELHSTETPASMVAKNTHPAVKGAGYQAASYQIYVYENPYTTSTDPAKRRTRVIVAGYYSPDGVTNETRTQDHYYYYPIDIVDDTGNVLPVERNHKYEFEITAVTGPGYDNFEDAMTGELRSLNVTVLEWDKSDEAVIGRRDYYYATMTDKQVTLERHAGSTETVVLSYEILDGIYDEVKIKFKDSEAEPVAGTIDNGYFRVALVQSPNLKGTATFTVTALRPYDRADAANFTNSVVVKFRDLTFEFDITQTDGTEWENGGDIDIGTPSEYARGNILVFAGSGANTMLALGSWGREINADNIWTKTAYFKYGSVVGLDNVLEHTVYDPDATVADNAVRFNPGAVFATGYANVPCETVAQDILATDNTLEKIRSGRGDPCGLVGLTAAQIAGFADEAEFQAALAARPAALRGWRMPTRDEMAAFAAYPVEFSGVGDGWADLLTTAITDPPAVATFTTPSGRVQLPLTGASANNGTPYMAGRLAYLSTLNYRDNLMIVLRINPAEVEYKDKVKVTTVTVTLSSAATPTRCVRD